MFLTAGLTFWVLITAILAPMIYHVEKQTDLFTTQEVPLHLVQGLLSKAWDGFYASAVGFLGFLLVVILALYQLLNELDASLKKQKELELALAERDASDAAPQSDALDPV